MIGYLNGKITIKNDPYVYIDVNGIGYKVLVSKSVISQIKDQNKTIQLFTYTYVREDALELFGFLQLEDLKLFENLITVQGIGPKTAINIFSIGSGKQIVQAIISSDVNFFNSVPRLGKKNAQKIIIELKSKFSDNTDVNLDTLDSQANNEATTALRNFGFTTKEIQGAFKNIDMKNLNTEEKIKSVLKYLGK